MTTTGQFHPSHPKHKLEWVNRQTSYKCNGCKEGGFGARYRCDRCDFDLHKACKEAKPSITVTPDLFGGCSFKFFDHPQGKGVRGCDACGRDIKGYVYHCKEADLDLHPCCLNLTGVIKVRDMEFRICDKAPPSKCCFCEKKLRKEAKGRSYVSSCETYYIHMSCVAEMLAGNWEMGYFTSSDDDDNNNNNNNINSLAPLMENRIPDRQLTSSKGGKKRKLYWKIAEIVLNTLMAILFGNPTQLLLLALNL